MTTSIPQRGIPANENYTNSQIVDKRILLAHEVLHHGNLYMTLLHKQSTTTALALRFSRRTKRQPLSQ